MVKRYLVSKYFYKERGFENLSLRVWRKLLPEVSEALLPEALEGNFYE